MYQPIKISVGANPRSNITTTFAKKGINLETYSQLLSIDNALNIENYLISASGNLKRRQGLSQLFTVAGGYRITMIKKFTNDLLMYAYNTTLAVYSISANASTVIKSNFTTSEPFSGVKYGDYFFISNGGDRIGRVSRTLAYDGQTGNFTAGLKVTGGTSGATGIILEDADSGATGTLTLGAVSGTFINNEAITDTSTGAALANGALAWTFTDIATAPKAKHLFVLGNRIYSGNTSTDETEVHYSSVDSGTNPPFSDWTVGANADDPGTFNFRNAGAVKGFGSIGAQVVVLYDDGKAGARIEQIDVSGTLTQNTIIDFQKIDFGGERGIATTPQGVFYCNEAGIFQLVSGGQTNVPFSDQEANISLALGSDLIEDLSFIGSDVVYDPKRNIVMFACSKDSSTNNLVLVYDLDNKAWTKFTGWNLSRFLALNDIIYASSDTSTTVYKLFDTGLDNGSPISTDYLQELNIGSFSERKSIEKFHIQGKLSASSSITVAFDIHDITGSFTENKKSITWTATDSTGGTDGFGSASWGISPFGGDVEANATIDSFSGANLKISNFQRIRVHITSNDTVSHEINLLKASVTNKGEIRRRNLNT